MGRNKADFKADLPPDKKTKKKSFLALSLRHETASFSCKKRTKSMTVFLVRLVVVVGAVRLMTAVCQEDKEKEVLFCYGSSSKQVTL